MMTNGEKARFCAFAASLFVPPDGALLDALQEGEFRSLFAGSMEPWGSDGQRSVHLLAALQGEYARLFGPWEGERISLVESTYKPWTTDKGCKMVFSASRGLIMGDPALHMRELYRQASVKVPDAFRATPDHLALELEFLALLYEHSSQEQVERFIGDHLDWIPGLEAEMKKAGLHPFYRDAIELIRLFLQQEGAHAEKKVH